jgi:Uma2 family endonuclease
MNTALKADFVSAADYLEGEELSAVRHEYVGGVVFAMAGGSAAHSLICCNVIAALHGQLRGPCRVFDANMKLRVELGDQDFFYYPDVTVSCHRIEAERNYNEDATVIIEVLSTSTERIDRIEKFDRYKNLRSLEHYVLVAQDKVEATVFSRARGWNGEIFSTLEGQFLLSKIEARLSLRDIYRGVPFQQQKEYANRTD